MNVTFMRTWKSEDVEADLDAAIKIVEALEPPEDLRLAVFNIAAQLMTQRLQVQADPRGIVPQMAVGIKNRGH